MARQRTKSLNDLQNQARRLSLQAMQDGNSERAEKILQIFSKYNNNIKNTKTSNKLADEVERKYKNGDMDGSNKKITERDTKQWARSTYMTGKTGNNGG